MFDMFETWEGKIEINDVLYDSIKTVPKTAFNGAVHIKLYPTAKERVEIAENSSKEEFIITVKKYMTEKASAGFDFMAQWNNDNPMPMRIMQGTVEKETRGMVYMKLHGLAKPTITCRCCGKELTNPISRNYGIGPICLEKMGIALDISDVANIREELVKVEWEGWIIRSAIISREEV